MFAKTRKHYEQTISNLSSQIELRDLTIKSLEDKLAKLEEPVKYKGISAIENDMIYNTDVSEFVANIQVPLDEISWYYKGFSLFSIGQEYAVAIYKGKENWFMVYNKEIHPISIDKAKEFLKKDVALYEKYFGKCEFA